jgi:metal-dependent HD superfamily phosphatase/phosphodiesterase
LRRAACWKIFVKVVDLAQLEAFVALGAVVHDVGHEIANDGRGPLIDV